MKCSDLKTKLFLSVNDGSLPDASLAEHLEVCPGCRSLYSEVSEMQADLARMTRPYVPATLAGSLKSAIRLEQAGGSSTTIASETGFYEWIQMRFMPYSIGVAASVLIGMTFLTMMFSGMLKTDSLPIAATTRETSILLASNSSPFANTGDNEIISPSEYAQTRLAFAGESPSVNPQGALVALTKSFVRGGMKDDEVVVVADVFGNGLARIAEVVEPSRDSQAVVDLQKALQSDPEYAAFLPTTVENRPDNVRVVLKFQSVNVSMNRKPRKR